MRVTVLPVRDPQRAEKPPPATSSRSREGSFAGYAPGTGFDGMPPTSVEILRAPRRSPVSASRAAPRTPAGPSPAAEPAPGSPPASAAMIEIMLTNGRIVRVPPGIPRAELERVLAIASAEDAPPAPETPPRRR